MPTPIPLPPAVAARRAERAAPRPLRWRRAFAGHYTAEVGNEEWTISRSGGVWTLDACGLIRTFATYADAKRAPADWDAFAARASRRIDWRRVRAGWYRADVDGDIWDIDRNDKGGWTLNAAGYCLSFESYAEAKSAAAVSRL